MLLLVLFCGSLPTFSSQFSGDAPQHIYLVKNMSSQIVQERETIEIPLGDYFKGSLLEYQYCIANRS
jgi:hypothetical protein